MEGGWWLLVIPYDFPWEVPVVLWGKSLTSWWVNLWEVLMCECVGAPVVGEVDGLLVVVVSSSRQLLMFAGAGVRVSPSLVQFPRLIHYNHLLAIKFKGGVLVELACSQHRCVCLWH
jgi:hypothetical protein